ncbi:hypothetical protein BH09GEM1_BH09GEM1_38810 [soil metagenome]
MSLTALALAAPPQAERPVVSTADVHRFVDALHRIGVDDHTCPAFRAYFASASSGLKAYASKFDVGTRELCAAIRSRPEWYATIEGKLPALDSAGAQVQAVFSAYLRFDPEAVLPGVYFVVGNGISGGTTVGWRKPIVLIGVERTGRTDKLASTIAHEFIHTQQHYPLMGTMTGGPRFMRGSLLRHSIKEGSANLIAELLTGTRQGNAYGETHAAALWREFLAVMRDTNYDRWLYNGWNAKALGERPPDLGYWMGYQISKAYYDKATDKRRAIHEMLSIRDFDQFVAESGYTGVALTGVSTPF